MLKMIFQGISINVILSLFVFVPISWAINNNALVELSSREELAKIAGYGEEKLSTVILHGTLLCGDHAPHPLPGASVAVFCRTNGPGQVRRSSWAKNITDESGEFTIDVPSHLHANIIHDPNLCHIQILHLPMDYSLCDHHSFTKKRTFTLTSSNIGSADGVRIYTTSTIHLTPKPSSQV
ncbi:hypothetical protein HAX54_013100 [Datura stramonium]|uniref:Pollen Ole e 1 allergen and extensin family protein n=1 Tax=Datura stramonium TaxID=4076 RepID=A0ABS8RYP5_DATST|nr:hypothetical protein [Datura stramonium]